MQEQLKLNLLEELSRQSGIVLNSNYDCKQLAEWLNNKGFAVSGHTISRMAGFMPTRKTYKTTYNILANAVGLKSWDFFCKYQTEFVQDLAFTNDTFTKLNSLSFSAIELALLSRNKLDLMRSTEFIDSLDEPNIMQLMRFGNLVRLNHSDKEFMELILTNKVTRDLLFNFYVDEDNPQDYYSKAIEKNLQLNSKSKDFEVFATTYIKSQSIYKNRKTKDNFKEIEADTLDHFHLKSRLLELKILEIDGDIKKFGNILSELEYCLVNCNLKEDASWYLARTIKAFASKGLFKEFIQIKFVSKLLSNQYKLLQNDILSTADLIVQYAYFVNRILIEKKEIAHLPYRLKYDHFNESNVRICVETALILLLYPQQKDRFSSLSSYSKQTGNEWVLKMLK